jgi:hypothetical protein
LLLSGPKQAGETGLHSGKLVGIHPSGAKSHVDFIDLTGTAKAVPFQIVAKTEFFRSL